MNPAKTDKINANRIVAPNHFRIRFIT
jgi:hypothetical protein